MTVTLDAIYENGVLRPLTPLALPEHAKVRVAVDDLRDDPRTSHAELESLLLSRLNGSESVEVNGADWSRMREEFKRRAAQSESL